LTSNLDTDSPDAQSIEEGIKFTNSKTQENCVLSKVFKSTHDPAKGQVLSTYLHNKTQPDVGKIGSIFVSSHLI
jgi:hypothetical protein